MEIMVFFMHTNVERKCAITDALLKYYSLWYIVESRRTVPNCKEARINNDNRKNKISPKK